MGGFEPPPLDFQSNASTKLASSPIVGVDGFEPPTHAGYQIYSLALSQFSLTPNCRRYRISTYDPCYVKAMLSR